MRKLLSRTLPVVLTFLLGVGVSVPGQSETAEKTIMRSALEPWVATGKPEPLTPPPARRLNVMLDWYLTPYHAPLVIAQERDLFAREGLEVTLTTPADPEVPPKLVAAQRTELALTSQPRLHLLIEQGLPLIRVGTLVPAPLATLLVREDGGIDALSQLKGRTVGYIHERPARMLLDGMLKGQSFTTDDIEFQHVDFALPRSLTEGEVDAVIGAMRYVAKQQLDQEGIAANEFLVEESEVPPYDEIILIANRNTLNQHRRDISRFLAALERATLWLINHPQQAWELVRRAEPGLDTEANARAWPDTLRYLALRPAVLQAQRYSNFEAYLRQQGLIDILTPVERLAVDLGNP